MQIHEIEFEEVSQEKWEDLKQNLPCRIRYNTAIDDEDPEKGNVYFLCDRYSKVLLATIENETKFLIRTDLNYDTERQTN